MRVLLIVIDQLPGHWAPGVEAARGVPPVNVWDYARLNLAPNFRRLVERGLFCFAWNMGECDTPHGMKYLATGRYDAAPYWTSAGGWPYYPRTPSNPGPTGLFEYAQHYAPGRIRPACFTTDHWIAPGYFYTCGYPVALSAYYPDDEVWRSFAAPFLKRRRGWNLVYVYFPTMDQVSNCPLFLEWNPHSKSSKHAYMLHLDELIGEVVSFLVGEGFWEETLLILASDHGYHAACTTAAAKNPVGASTPNWCCDHPPPHDCEVWDYSSGRGAGTYSGCTRRVLLLLSGGALDEGLRGRVLPEAEIVDVAATIADFLDVPYECEGTSVLRRKGEAVSLDFALAAPTRPGRRPSGSPERPRPSA